jgi:hypothetical protein
MGSDLLRRALEHFLMKRRDLHNAIEDCGYGLCIENYPDGSAVGSSSDPYCVYTQAGDLVAEYWAESSDKRMMFHMRAVTDVREKLGTSSRHN